MKENILISGKSTTILSILILSLFIQIRFEVFTLIVRPFDIILVLIFINTLFKKNEIIKQKLSSGFFYLLPFFFIHFVSALVVSNQNFIKEFLQVIIFSVKNFKIFSIITYLNLWKTVTVIFIKKTIFQNFVGTNYFSYFFKSSLNRINFTL